MDFVIINFGNASSHRCCAKLLKLAVYEWIDQK